MKKVKAFFFALFVLLTCHINAQLVLNKIKPKLLNQEWDAQWITQTVYKAMPGFPTVCLFRKTFHINNLTNEFLINISADNRYKLYINNNYVGNGPARSVPTHWNFETYDLSSYLVKGENILAVQVWTYGNDLKPWGQTTGGQLGLIVQGNSNEEKIINTNQTWEVTTSNAYDFKKVTSDIFHHLTGVGPCEIFDASKHFWDWNNNNNDTIWQQAATLINGYPAKSSKNCDVWSLEPRIIPQLEYKKQRIENIDRSSLYLTDYMFDGKSVLEIPANTQASILFDNETLNVGYPNLIVDKGNQSKIRLTYAEALFDKNNVKHHRDSVANMEIKGYYDEFIADGACRHFETLWFKTYRYVQLDIETKDEPLVINDFYICQSVYPFEKKAEFSCSDPELEKIFNVGWRTARLCALENYVDCPYYEQVQYFGDQNISNPITVWLSGDSRLMKSTILQAVYSQTPDKLTTAASPGSNTVIPFYSITVIGIMNNYLEYSGDAEFIAMHASLIDDILMWYNKKINNNGMLGPMSYWNFVDCNNSWPWDPDQNSICEPEGTKNGNSSILTLQYVYGLQLAAKIFAYLGDQEKSASYSQKAEIIKQAVYEHCWDDKKQYIADTPDKNSFSQHANIFAVLVKMFNSEISKSILERLIHDKTLTQTSLQYQAYFHKCLIQENLVSEYTNYLGKWRNLIAQGFSTFPEYPETDTRSDCHAWSAYPAIEMFSIICGIQITEPGFKAVKIEPCLNNLEWVKAKLPWKNGFIEVDLKNEKNHLSGFIKIPEGLEADILINGNRHIAKGKDNTYTFK